RYDLDNSDEAPLNLTPDAPKDFHPLGLSLFQDDAGRETLMVINRRSQTPSRQKPNQIILYDWINGQLIQKRVVEGKGLIAPNDLVAIGHNRFYVTNDHGYEEGLLAAIEEYLPMPVGMVSYFDGEAFRSVADGFSFANGINQSPDGSKIYVTATVGQSLSIFERDRINGSLTLIKDIDLETGPDNITLDDQGNLWIAAHPQLLSFIGYVGDETKYTPSQIFKLLPGIGGQLIPQNVMVDAGDLISGASVAAAIGNRFLVGGPYEEQFLDCSL
ncbi:MAG: SMP-30/gluconolactonase/LRE family protein, partial [Sneathiella sp.]|nr:SMP-30/gluconolactonase/LRE family protein [Sneathiella sp.]